MEKKCVICGKPSGMYPLCYEHMKMKNEGKVIKCKICGLWHLSSEPCPICKTKEIIQEYPKQKEKKTEEKTEEKIEEQTKKSSCILCGKEANGYLFCKECYNLYKEKTILIRVNNCIDFSFDSVVDEYGNATYKCTDGHMVRSKSEVIIDNFLYNNNIMHVYEKELIHYEKNGESKIIKPDFYLPNYNLYIEHWGYENKKDYLATKAYKENIYKTLGLNIFGTTEKDIEKLDSILKPLLKLH